MLTRALVVSVCLSTAGTLATTMLANAAPTQQAPESPRPSQPPPERPKPDDRSKKDDQKKDDQKKEEQQTTFEETVVVTASKTERELVNAPATVSVITGAAIEIAPVETYADLFRTVPGVNVTQLSARDINLTSRGATGTLAASELILLDGRSVYQDFFGFAMWDLLPVNFGEIDQIEVIRGPASAVWGPNALSGVVNIITKSPRELPRESLTIGAGAFDRSVGSSNDGTGSLFSVNGTHARAVNERWAYKISAGVLTQDPFARPAGVVPNEFRTPYPAFTNEGTTQPKFDTRVDYDPAASENHFTFSGGIAGTSGLVHTGIGPFRLQNKTRSAYGKMAYRRGSLRADVFVSTLNGDAVNLLNVEPDGDRLVFRFASQTYDGELNHSLTLGRHLVTYGGNIRHNSFDLSIAPRGSSRDEGGVFVQDEIFLSDHFRWLVGARVDKFDIIDGAVFSPRTTFMYKPSAPHTIRVSYNRGFRAPSLVNNFLDVTIVNELDLGLINPALAGRTFIFPVEAIGAEDLRERALTAYELGYTGLFPRRTTVSAAVYVNDSKDDIYFTQVGSYSSAAPPPNWPLPPVVLDALIAGNAFGPGLGLPSAFSYRNFGRVRDKGVELGVETAATRDIQAYVNYSFQATPVPRDFERSQLNIPPRHRFNIGGSYNRGRYLGSLSIAYTDTAFWQDVLDARYHGSTPANTLVNTGFGVRWMGDHVRTSIKVMNLTDRDIQQHIFGDVLKRQFLAEARLTF